MSYPLPEHLRDSVRIAWHITSWCNYSCDYCPVLIFHKRGKNGDKRDHAFDHYPAEQWLDAFRERFPQKDILLKITGGEPFLDRENFHKILSGVLAMPQWSIQIDTNGSWDPAYFQDIDKSRLSLNVAFHPHMTTFEAFYKRVLRMRELGFHVEMLNFVLAPENLDEFDKRLRRVEQDGFFVNLSPMNPTGAYLSRSERTRREMDLIERYNVPIDVKYKVVRPPTRGRPCYHPALSYYLMFDGKIQIYCVGKFQNLFTDGPPPLPREAVPCTLSECIGCTEMYRALADEPLVTRPLSLYHRGEYVAEVAEHRRKRRLYSIAEKIPFAPALLGKPISFRDQLPVPPRRADLLAIDPAKPPLPDSPVFGCLETEASVRAYGRDRIYLAGWVASSRYGAPIAELRLLWNGDELALVRHFHARPDVAERFQRPELETSGWKTMVWLPAAAPGDYTLSVEGVAPDGTRCAFAQAAVQIVG